MEKFFFVSFVFPCALMSFALLGIPENAGVMYHFRPLVAPLEGRAHAANSDFVPFRFGIPENVEVL